jgi:hypothetical protein
MNDNFTVIHNDDLMSDKEAMPGIRLLTINQDSVNLRKVDEIRANIVRREEHEKRSSES